jgi:hypothetical protein
MDNETIMTHSYFLDINPNKIIPINLSCFIWVCKTDELPYYSFHFIELNKKNKFIYISINRTCDMKDIKYFKSFIIERLCDKHKFLVKHPEDDNTFCKLSILGNQFELEILKEKIIIQYKNNIFNTTNNIEDDEDDDKDE